MSALISVSKVKDHERNGRPGQSPDIRDSHCFLRSPILSLAHHDAPTPFALTVSTHKTPMPLAKKRRLS